MNKTVRHNNSFYCPSCGHKLDASTPITKEFRQPKTGDHSLCIVCGEILQYKVEKEWIDVERIRPEVIKEMAEKQPRNLARLIHAQNLIRLQDWDKRRSN